MFGSWLKNSFKSYRKTDEEHAQETEKNAVEIASVANYAFSLLTIYQKRHVYLECITNDFENNTSTANALLDELHSQYLTKLNEKGGYT